MNLGTETGTQINSLKSSASAGEVSPSSKAQMSRRGRRAVPTLKNARFALAQAQREVAGHGKAVRKAAEVVGSIKIGSTAGSTRSTKGTTKKGAKISTTTFAVLNKARTLLKAAKSIEEKAIKALAADISAEAAKSRLIVHANVIKVFKGK